MTARTGRRDQTINLRAASSQTALIERAAKQARESRSEFMLRASLERAESVLADRTRLVLTQKQWAALQKALDSPLPKPKALAKLLGTPAPWDK